MIDDPTHVPDPPTPPVRVLTITISEILLGLIGFAGLFVGGTLVWGVMTTPDLPGEARGSWVPPGFLAYGVATTIAFIAERRRWRWALAAVLASQLPWAIGLGVAYLTIAPDWSLLVAVGLALAASAGSVLVHVSRTRRR